MRKELVRNWMLARNRPPHEPIDPTVKKPRPHCLKRSSVMRSPNLP